MLGVQLKRKYSMVQIEKGCLTHESMNRSRLTQSGFEGLKLMNLLNKTCATGAMPIGAPGCPEFALKVASTF